MRYPATSLLCALALSLAADAAAQSASELPLTQVAEAVLQKHTTVQPAADAAGYRTAAWLAAVPRLGLSHLASNESEGTDETELRLGFALKSGFAREQDRIMEALGEQLATAGESARRLYYSGLLREALWSLRLAETRAEYSARKISRLQQLAQRQEALFEARSASRSSLLLIKLELADARSAQQQQLWQVDDWQQRYRDLTGLATLPPDPVEAPLPPSGSRPPHPQLRLLDLQWQRQQAVLAAGSSRASEWHLALLGKHLDSPGHSEDQYGVALELPLTLFDVNDGALASEWREASREHWQRRDELALVLHNSERSLAREAAYLSERQTLLQRAAAVSAELSAEAEALSGDNLLDREFWLRRVLADLDRQADVAVNRVQIQQNLAMRRQAAGLPL